MAKNAGKLFEDDIKASVPDDCWIYRLRDNASSFAGGGNTRFTSSNICDFLLLDDMSRILYLIECKSTKGTSIPLSMIRQSQIDGLREASRHCLVAGLLVNFRNENNDTFFIKIDDYINMLKSLNKKSFNARDLRTNGAFGVACERKRTRYRYDIRKMCDDIQL